MGYIGFPTENLNLGRLNAKQPEPVFLGGKIAKISDPFQLRLSPVEYQQLLLIDSTSTGGASGSPLFDTDGEVIGIVSGGDVLTINNASRTNLAAERPVETALQQARNLARASLISSAVGEASGESDLGASRLPVGMTVAVRADLVPELVGEKKKADRQPNWSAAQRAFGRAATSAYRSVRCVRSRGEAGRRRTRLPNGVRW